MKTELNISFFEKFQIRFTVRMVAFALQVFDQMQDRFEKENDLRIKVESEKEDFFSIFKSTVKQEKV